MGSFEHRIYAGRRFQNLVFFNKNFILKGMCDIVAPLLVVINDEVIVYSCFTNLMERMIK